MWCLRLFFLLVLVTFASFVDLAGCVTVTAEEDAAEEVVRVASKLPKLKVCFCPP